MILSNKQKAWVGGAVALIIGLVQVIVPFITDAAVLHYVNMGLAVLGGLAVYFGVYRTSNVPTAAKVDLVSPPIVLPAGMTLTPHSDPVELPTTAPAVTPATATPATNVAGAPETATPAVPAAS